MSSAEYERLVAAARQVEELERLGAIRIVRERLAEGRLSEGTVDDLFAAAESRYAGTPLARRRASGRGRSPTTAR